MGSYAKVPSPIPRDRQAPQGHRREENPQIFFAALSRILYAYSGRVTCAGPLANYEHAKKIAALAIIGLVLLAKPFRLNAILASWLVEVQSKPLGPNLAK
jgi:hypothetical protein